jgi:prostaglandin E receptor 4
MTRSLLRRILFFFTIVALALCFLPFVGFGTYIDWTTNKCVRYRDATDPLDISYAFIFFTFGESVFSLHWLLTIKRLPLGITLCTSLVLFNLSVTKVLYRSHASISSILNAHNDSIRRIYPRPNRSVPVAADADSMNGLTNAQLSLPEELRFAKLMTWLSIAFVICWVPQLVRKLRRDTQN